MTFELDEDDALVLHDLLGTYAEADSGRELSIRSAAERNALWALSAALDKQLLAPFEQNYDELLAAARRRVEQRGGPWD